MGYRFAPDQFAVAIDDRAVALDVAADRYRLLGPPAASALVALERGETHPAFARLVAMGILSHGSNEPGPLLPPVHASAIERPPAMVATDLHFPSVGLAVCRAIVSLRVRGLRFALAAARRRAVATAIDPDRLIPLSQVYGRLRSMLPLHDICLPDSLALHALLCRRGLASTLVIGVRLDPFMAHCWLQAGGIVLNDTCDHVSPYRPILHL